MVATVCRCIGRHTWSFGIILVLIGCASVSGGQTPAGNQLPVEQQPAPDRQEFDATVATAQGNRLEFQTVDRRQLLSVALSPELLAKLRVVPDRRYRVLLAERPTPGGVGAAVRLRDERGLYALAETIHDRPLLEPAEREGIVVEPLPAEKRALVYEDNCKAVYNVPTAFTIANERTVVYPSAAPTVKMRDAGYTISLTVSQFVVLKECPIPFERPRLQVEYAIVRNQ